MVILPYEFCQRDNGGHYYGAGIADLAGVIAPMHPQPAAGRNVPEFTSNEVSPRQRR